MKVIVLPTNQELEVDSQKSLMQICTENKIEIKSLCKGKPSCAECRIKLVSGEASVNPPSQAELALIGSNYYLDGRRLSCQVYCFGDVTIDITEQLERQDSSAKKIRGFRGQTKSTSESQAKRDTFILNDDSRVENAGGTAADGQSSDDHKSSSSPPGAARSQRPSRGGGAGGRNRPDRSPPRPDNQGPRTKQPNRR